MKDRPFALQWFWKIVREVAIERTMDAVTPKTLHGMICFTGRAIRGGWSVDGAEQRSLSDSRAGKWRWTWRDSRGTGWTLTVNCLESLITRGATFNGCRLDARKMSRPFAGWMARLDQAKCAACPDPF